IKTMAIAISAGARKRRSTKPSRTPFRRPIRFQSSSRRRAGALVVPDSSHSKGAIPTKRPRDSLTFVRRMKFGEERQGIIPALWARMSLRRPVFLLPAHRHRHSVVAAHGLGVAERHKKKGFDPCPALTLDPRL